MAATKVPETMVITQAFLPSGSLIPFAGATEPDGFLLCGGQAVSRTAFASLFAVIGTTYGVGDGSTTFNLPDLRGRTAVGKDNMVSAASRITSGGSGIDGAALGAAGGSQNHTLTVSEMPSHTHTQDSHNHTQNAHTHTQDSHNHTQNAHTHTQNAHNHGLETTNNAGTLGGSRNWVIGWNTNNGTAGALTGSGSFVHNTTATNQNTTATNNAATATNQNTTATNNAATATNQNTGGGGAHLNVQPSIILNYLIKT